MASSPSAALACRLWPSPAGIPPVTNTTTSSPPLPGGLLTVSSASMVSSLPFWQSRTSPFPGRSLLLNPICSSRDPGEIDAIHVANSEQPQGGSIDSRSNGKEPAKSFSSKELLEKLKRYGVAGVLSYGILNTIYYTTTFVLVWFYFSPAPGGMGYPAAVERFLKLIAMVWAGSQVTKILRAGGALALAPFVDRGLRLFTVKFNFESEGKAVAAIVGFCFALAVLLFFGLTLLWA